MDILKESDLEFMKLKKNYVFQFLDNPSLHGIRIAIGYEDSPFSAVGTFIIEKCKCMAERGICEADSALVDFVPQNGVVEINCKCLDNKFDGQDCGDYQCLLPDGVLHPKMEIVSPTQQVLYENCPKCGQGMK
ncbi:hypothetical protein Ciccas_004502, partial [Cichlidogyrus casuarinus]